jgi:glycosyltransferase involved in cell wall biosynthesis
VLLASRTPPVEEVVRDEYNGFLVNFFSPQQIAERVDELLNRRDELRLVRDRWTGTISLMYVCPRKCSCCDALSEANGRRVR